MIYEDDAEEFIVNHFVEKFRKHLANMSKYYWYNQTFGWTADTRVTNPYLDDMWYESAERFSSTDSYKLLQGTDLFKRDNIVVFLATVMRDNNIYLDDIFNDEDQTYFFQYGDKFVTDMKKVHEKIKEMMEKT